MPGGCTADAFSIPKEFDTRRLRLSSAKWHSDVDGECFSRIVHTPYYEVVVFICVLGDLTMSVLVLAASSLQINAFVLLVCATCLLGLSLDVFFRASLQGFRKFIGRWLNCLEFLLVLIGNMNLLLDVYYFLAGSESDSFVRGTAAGRSLRPVLRMLRLVRVMSRLVSSKASIQALHDKFWKNWLTNQLRIFFVLSRDNVVIQPSMGLFHVEKAQFKTTVLEGIHLPLTLSCGIVDMFHVKVNLHSSRGSSSERIDMWINVWRKLAKFSKLFPSIQKIWNQRHKTDDNMADSALKVQVVVENIHLVLGPGHHCEPPAPQWEYDRVALYKHRLLSRLDVLEIMVRTLPGMSGKKKLQGKTNIASKMKALFAKKAMDFVLGGVHVSIRNFEIRFEDGMNYYCAPYPVVRQPSHLKIEFGTVLAGFRIGAFCCHARACNERDVGKTQATGKWKVQSPDAAYAEEATNHGGVSLLLEAHRVSCFWDHQDMLSRTLHRGSPFRLTRYTEIFRREVSMDINNFLEWHAKFRLYERMRGIVVAEVERRLCERDCWRREVLQRLWDERQWKPPLRARQSERSASAREMARRLWDVSSFHDYLLWPCDLRAEVHVHPTNQQGATDFRAEVPILSVSCDALQISGITRMVDYIMRWRHADRMFQWMPPPRQKGGAIAVARWVYALQKVLLAINPDRKWRCLAWIGFRRRSRLRGVYAQACKNNDPLSMFNLQVAMPIRDVMAVRRQVRAQRETKMKPQDAAKDVVRVIGKKISKRISKSSSEVGATLEEGGLKSAEESRFSIPKDDAQKPSSSENPPRAFQVMVEVGSVRGTFLQKRREPRLPRRPFIRAESTNVSAFLIRGAPQAVWRCVAPYSAVDEATSCCLTDSCGSAVEFGLKELKVIFCAAPLSSPWFRRLCYGGAATPKVASAPAGLEKDMQHMPWLSNETKIPTVFLRMRVAINSKLRASELDGRVLGKRMKHLHVSACAMPLEVRICKEILAAIRTSVNETRGGGSNIRSSRVGDFRFDNSPSCGPELSTKIPTKRITSARGLRAFVTNIADFTTQMSRKKTNAPRSTIGTMINSESLLQQSSEISQAKAANWQLSLQKRLRDEALMGCSGPLANMLITCKVLLLGGAHASTLTSYSTKAWLNKCFSVRAGTIFLDKRRIGPGVQMRFKPLMPDGPGSKYDKPVQTADGWWHESGEEAALTNFTGNQVSKFDVLLPGGTQGVRDRTCVGKEAGEAFLGWQPESAATNDFLSDITRRINRSTTKRPEVSFVSSADSQPQRSRPEAPGKWLSRLYQTATTCDCPKKGANADVIAATLPRKPIAGDKLSGDNRSARVSFAKLLRTSPPIGIRVDEGFPNVECKLNVVQPERIGLLNPEDTKLHWANLCSVTPEGLA